MKRKGARLGLEPHNEAVVAHSNEIYVTKKPGRPTQKPTHRESKQLFGLGLDGLRSLDVGSEANTAKGSTRDGGKRFAARARGSVCRETAAMRAKRL